MRRLVEQAGDTDAHGSELCAALRDRVGSSHPLLDRCRRRPEQCVREVDRLLVATGKPHDRCDQFGAGEFFGGSMRAEPAGAMGSCALL